MTIFWCILIWAIRLNWTWSRLRSPAAEHPIRTTSVVLPRTAHKHCLPKLPTFISLLTQLRLPMLTYDTCKQFSSESAAIFVQAELFCPKCRMLQNGNFMGSNFLSTVSFYISGILESFTINLGTGSVLFLCIRSVSNVSTLCNQ